MVHHIPARRLLLLFSALCLMFGLCLPPLPSAASADRHFAAGELGEAYYKTMKAEMADLVRLKVKGNNVRVRDGAGTSFGIDHEAQRGNIFYAKKDPVKGTDGLWWYEIAGALYRQGDTVAQKLERKFICADFVTAGPLSRDTKNAYGDVGFIERHIYKVFPKEMFAFTLDRDTPFHPDPDCPLVTDMGKNVLPAGVELYYGYHVVSDDGYLEFFAKLALPEGHLMDLGRIRLEDYARLNFGKNEKAIRKAIEEAVRLNKGRIRNELP